MTEVFDEFFESGKEESISPFLTIGSRKFGKHLPLKASLIAAGLLLLSVLFYRYQNFSSLCIVLTYFFAGIPALISSIEDLLDWEINIDILMTLAAFLSIFIDSAKEGALLLVLFSFSGAMEHAVRSKAKGAISSLKKMVPTQVFVVQDDGSLMPRYIKDVAAGVKIHVKAGEMVPLDGEVIGGQSSVNLAHLTGESVPIECGVGDQVAAGARNLDGALTVRVTHTSSDSTLAKIIELVSSAQEAKPKLQRFFDGAARAYALSIIGLSFAFALLLPLFTSLAYVGPEGSIYRALAFLIAASPCALVLAIPIAYLSAISSCARKGVLLKGGIVLDALARCDTIAFDKTGTLTLGRLRCLGVEDEEALAIAYGLEQNSTHPIAEAICAYAKERGVAPALISEFKSHPGLGLEGKFDNRPVWIGKVEEGADVEELHTYLKVEDKLFLFRFEDQIRPQVREAIESLSMRTMMVSGDHRRSAQRVADEVGIDEVYADLSPKQKLEVIASHEKLAMVGDGINDAPSLARAMVGISMGTVGSKTAIDASDVVLLHDELHLLRWLFAKARTTKRIVTQNLFVALCAILIASLPALLGWVPLWLAVILHEGGTVLVGLNALRLLVDGKAVARRSSS